MAALPSIKKVAVIIPCYNEEDAIAGVLDELSKLPAGYNYQLVPVVINDCSTDNTLHILQTSGCIYLDLPVNLGIGGAVQTGFRYARENDFDIAVQFDGDGQHPADQIAELIQPVLNEVADVVIGSRFIKKEGFQSTFFRRLGINYLKFFCKFLTGKNITDCTSGFRVINRKGIAIVNDYYPDEYPEPEALILYTKNGLRIKEIPVVMKERRGGKSSINHYNSIYYMVKVSLAMLFINIRLKYNGKN